MKNLLKTIYSLEVISDLLDSKLSKSTLVYIFYCLILNFALAMSFINMKTINPSLLSKNIYKEITKEVLEELPDCRVKNQALKCKHNESYEGEFADFNLFINSDNAVDKNKTNIIFTEKEVKISKKEQEMSFDYRQFTEFDFKDFSSPQDFITDLTNRLFTSIKPQIIFPALLTIYGIVIGFDIFFIFALAIVGLLLNIGSKKSLSIKQLLNLIIYSALLPTFISLFVSLLASPVFGVVIYNFALAIVFIYNYKKLTKGNFSQIE